MDDQIRQFVVTARHALPDAAASADRNLSEGELDGTDASGYLWIEAVAEATNRLLRARETQRARAHLAFFSRHLAGGPPAVRECIKVSYAQNLLWNLPPEDRRWAWPLIPANLQACYAALWGRPDAPDA